jgi:hypothetical protein
LSTSGLELDRVQSGSPDALIPLGTVDVSITAADCSSAWDAAAEQAGPAEAFVSLDDGDALPQLCGS